MIDALGREIEYLRVSVTQNCNLSCIYCKPGGTGAVQRECEQAGIGLLPMDFERIIRVMAGLGITKVRITGGEPLTRPDICDIISRISDIPGISDISMTTNGIKLAGKASALKAAGLRRLNISLDSLKPDRFSYITGGGRLQDTLEGIKEAVLTGLEPVKINTVLVKGLNDDEVDSFIELAGTMPLEVRFIELMPVGQFGEINRDRMVPNTGIIASHPQLVPCFGDAKGQPAKYYRIEGYIGKIGFISPMSHKFCNECNRIRLTCDGKLKPCLGNNGEIDIMEALRSQDSSRLEKLIRETVYNKPAGHNFEHGYNSGRGMNAIGG